MCKEVLVPVLDQSPTLPFNSTVVKENTELHLVLSDHKNERLSRIRALFVSAVESLVHPGWESDDSANMEVKVIPR